jgi:hypothetical protein
METVGALPAETRFAQLTVGTSNSAILVRMPHPAASFACPSLMLNPPKTRNRVFEEFPMNSSHENPEKEIPLAFKSVS